MQHPEQIALEVAEKLASRDRHVVFLLGAGASCAAGLPNLDGLKTAVEDVIAPDWADKYTAAAQGKNIEEVLTRLRLLAEALGGSTDSLDGLTAESAIELDKSICSAVATVIRDASGPSSTHDDFAQWISQSRYTRPVEIFTTNYDILIEEALERALVPYFDGFVGIHQGRFRPDLVDGGEGVSALAPPQGWPRVWKLHGSVSWTLLSEGLLRTIVREGTSGGTQSEALAIYPSTQKYQESRRMPFVVLADRLRRALAIPKSICVVSGYSFGDQHINEVLYEAAQLNPSSEILALFYSTIPAEPRERSLLIQNMTLLSANDAVIGGQHVEWTPPEQDSPFWREGKFTLGDFGALSGFLRRANGPRSQSAPDATTAAE